jgi:hypothetical protein
MSMQNVGKGRLYDDNDIGNAAQSFSEWKKSGGPGGDEFRKQAHAKIEDLGYKGVLLHVVNWGWNCYLRGFLLVLLLFIIRMANRKGIVETILAGKKKFFLAVILWPLFIMKYPFNVVKEIIVEAEIRRLGNTFRRLTEKEKEFVAQVASENNFWQWLLEFRSENSMLFQKSFVTALISVIIIHLFLPTYSQARSLDLNRDGPAIAMDNFEGVVSISDGCDSQSEFQLIYHDAISSESYFEIAEKTSVILKIFERKMKLESIFRKIEHIPVFGR